MELQKMSLQGRLSAFLRGVQKRYPDAEDVCKDIRTQVLIPISTGKDPKDFQDLVSLRLRRAPELVLEFRDIITAFERDTAELRKPLVPARPPEPFLSFSSFSPSFQPLNHSSNVGGWKVPFARPEPQQTLQAFTDNADNSHCKDKSQDTHYDDIQKLLVLSDVDIPPHRRMQTPSKMSIKLMEHQKVCLTWLVEQEVDQHKKGGLLADTMGLGKTIQALALILERPSRDPKCKTTLIVAPLALLRQWEQEISTKVKPQHKLKTVVYHGAGAQNLTVSQLLEHDIVLCTYGKLQTEYKNKYEHKKVDKLRILAEKVKFYRVILDEAHNIRNQLTISSKAAADIGSEYRLCMTGTPIMNRAEEIFPLIRFLNISPYNEWGRFSEDIIRPLRKWDGDIKQHAMIKLQALFRSFTLRRTKDSRLDGNPIIELPPRIDQIAYASFNDEQREFYHALEVQQRLKFNKYLSKGAVMNNYLHILILLLRLRQACDHPFLLKNQGIPDGAKLNERQMLKLACELPRDIVDSIKRQEIFGCLLCKDETENPIIVHPCGHLICAHCFTASVMISRSEVSGEATTDEDEEDGEGKARTQSCPCPGEGCKHNITPSNIICFTFLNDVPDSDSDLDDAEHSEAQFYGEVDDDVDRNGNLEGFIVISDDDSSDQESDLVGAEKGHEDDGLQLESDRYGRMVSAGAVGIPQTDGSYDDSCFQNAGRNARDGATRSDAYGVVSGRLVESYGSGDNLATPNRNKRDWRKRDQYPETPKRLSNINTELNARRPKRKKSDAKLVANSRKKSRTVPRETGLAASKYHPCKTLGGRKKKGKGNRKEHNLKPLSLADQRQAAHRNAMAMSRYKERLRKEWISSAKIDKIMEILEDVRQRQPKEKTLIFSLWPSFLDLLEVPVERARLDFTRYDGSMSPDAREAAVRSFMEDAAVDVMLVSLTAGNAGLNLTAASHVIITEPFWNPFVEEQAIDRAHRIGQKRPVTVHRVLVAGTVEDRVLALQERKKMLVGAALSEKAAASVSRLDVAELMSLFGCK